MFITKANANNTHVIHPSNANKSWSKIAQDQFPLATIPVVDWHTGHEPRNFVETPVAAHRRRNAAITNAVIFSCNPLHPGDMISWRHHLERVINSSKHQILTKPIDTMQDSSGGIPEIRRCRLKDPLLTTGAFVANNKRVRSAQRFSANYSTIHLSPVPTQKSHHQKLNHVYYRKL
jgi:hypothetical protein